eukprot:m.73855 g.73855  ORF g.73855 m.73855 type:complete len:488 (+) comp14343_c0_seq1:55-1518(+)
MSLIEKARALKNKAVDMAMNYSPAEVKVREATNPDEAWGPHGTIMAEIAKFTYSYEDYPEAMGMLWQRILKNREGKHWRRIYKGLLVLDHLIRNGSSRVIDSARDHVYDLRQLERFEFLDKTGRDQGINVRQKAKNVCELLSDDDRIRAERKTAKANRDRYKGIGNPNFDGYDEEVDVRDDFERRRGGGGGGQRTEGRFYDDEDDGGSYGRRREQSSRSQSKWRDDDDDGDDDQFGTLRSSEPAPAPAQAAPQSGGLIDLMGDTNNGNADAFEADFNPRGGAAQSTVNDDFGAFTDSSTTASASNNNDEFAAFASAPTAAPTQPTADLFGSLSSAPAPAQPATSNPMDLFGSMTSAAPAQAAPAANFDLLAPAPASSAPSSGGVDLLGGMGSSAPAPAPAKTQPNVPKSIGGVNISLDNLSLNTAQPSGKAKTSGKSVFEGGAGPQSTQSGSSAPMMGGMGMQQPMGGMGMQQPMMGGMQQQGNMYR